MEALVENNLIKEYSPSITRCLRTTRRILTSASRLTKCFPGVSDQEVKRDKARYFGPYTAPRPSGNNRPSQENLQDTDMPDSSEDIGKERPCLYYYIGQCDAPCQGLFLRKNIERI